MVPLEVPKGVPSRLRLVHSRQDRKLGVLLGCRSSPVHSVVKGCLAALVYSRLPLEVLLIHLAQTVASAHLSLRCSHQACAFSNLAYQSAVMILIACCVYGACSLHVVAAL